MTVYTLVVEKMHQEVACGRTVDEAASVVIARYPNLCLELMEQVGSWPSSEPLIAAIQRRWP